MSYKENLRKTYNKIAKDWNLDHLNDNWWEDGLNNFANLVGKNNIVLDIGCGSGIVSKMLLDRGLKVVGIDLSEEMIKTAKKKFPESEFLVMDMESINLKRKFDGIFAKACLLHTKKENAALVVNKWAKLLNPNGYMYIAVKISNKGIDEEIIKENDYGYEYERFFSFYTKEEIEKYLKSAGLEIVFSVVVPNGKTNWIQMIGQKK